MTENEKYDLYSFNDSSIEGKLLLIWKKLVDIEDIVYKIEKEQTIAKGEA